MTKVVGDTAGVAVTFNKLVFGRWLVEIVSETSPIVDKISVVFITAPGKY